MQFVLNSEHDLILRHWTFALVAISSQALVLHMHAEHGKGSFRSGSIAKVTKLFLHQGLENMYILR